ncbi:kinase-like domain-containing protein [Mycena olivaceomarginata]|nr:kinase-like domain-containing protein [Mycena olivaceomarginata]
MGQSQCQVSEPSEPRLVLTSDVWRFDKDPEEFAFTAMLWEQNGDFYHYRREERHSDADADLELFQKAILVPRDYYLARLPPPGAPATRAPSTSFADPNVFFKRTEPIMYDPTHTEKCRPADDQADEMRICEELRQNPHPNICRYLGYVTTLDGNSIAGLCFERHEMNLDSAIEDNFSFNAAAVIEDVRSGLDHLHSLGYAHNDINPGNIVLTKTGLAVIIDFDSCHKIGESLRGKKAGTVNWDHQSKISLPENDYHLLREVEKWLAENVRETHGLENEDSR